MFSFLKKQKVNIHSIAIADFGWETTKNDSEIIQYINPEHTVAVSINFFNYPPDTPTIKDIDLLRNFYRNAIVEIDGGLIEVELFQLRNITFLKTLIKIPQGQSGITYIASLTMPFKSCSFVVKVQAVETGTTGMREALVANQMLSSHDSTNALISNWSSDPYDSTFKKGTLMNKSEQEIYDPLFPDHPLTKARQLITQLGKEINWASEIDKLQPFDK